MRSSGPTEGKPATVCILGAGFGTSNLGVSALASGTIHAALRAFPGAELFFLDYGREPVVYEEETPYGAIGVSLLNIRFSKKVFLANNIAWLLLLAGLIRLLPSRNWRDALRRKNVCFTRIVSADVVASLAGGDSFSDIYGLVRLLYVSLPQLLIIFLNKKLILLPQTIGPFKGGFAKVIARFILKRAHIIYSRDHYGLIEIKDLMGKKDLHGKLRFCHDVGFVVAPIKPTKMDLGDLSEQKEGVYDLIGLNVSGLLFMGGYTMNNMFGLKSNYQELTYDLIDFLIKKKDLSVMLVPHVFGQGKNSESDSTVCENIYADLKSKYPGKLFLVKGNYNQSEIKYIIGMCNFFIGARMHACIAALSQCIPAVGIAYSKKFKGVFETVGVENLIADPRTMGKEEIIEVICTALKYRMKVKAKLQQIMPQVKNNIYDIFKDIDMAL